MTRLMLLDFEGEEINDADISVELNVLHSVKILITGDGYPGIDKGQIQFVNHYKALIKKIYSTPPFSYLKVYRKGHKYLEKLMVFAVPTVSRNWGPKILRPPADLDLGDHDAFTHETNFDVSVNFDPSRHEMDIGMSYDSTKGLWVPSMRKLIDFLDGTIENHSFPSGYIVNAHDVWVDPVSNNYGNIIVMTPFPANYSFGQYFPQGTEGYTCDKDDFLSCVLTVADLNVEYWANIVIHELGHAIGGLADEYDQYSEFPDSILDRNNPPLNPSAKERSILDAPNIMFRGELDGAANEENSEMSIGSISASKIKKEWLNLMTQSDKERINNGGIGYFSFSDFWKIDAAGNVVRDANGHPVIGDTFPNHFIAHTIMPGKEFIQMPDGEPMQVWRFPYAILFSMMGEDIMLVEGAITSQRNVFRSSLECIMRYVRRDPIVGFYPGFCKVCSYALKKKLGIGSSIVIGTDGKDYICVKSHLSMADSMPITGLYWSEYWRDHGTTGMGDAWVAGKSYEL